MRSGRVVRSAEQLALMLGSLRSDAEMGVLAEAVDSTEIGATQEEEECSQVSWLHG